MENSEGEELIRKKLKAELDFHSDDNHKAINSMDTSITQPTICGKEALQQYDNDKCMETTINNNHHVVPIGVLIVLVTIYLGMNGIQKSFVTCSENQVMDGLLRNTELEEQHIIYTKNLKGSHILERLLEYKDICKDLEVFTKDININNYTHDEEDNVSSSNGVEKEITSSGSGSGSGSGECTKPYSKKHKKTKHLIKHSSNGKYGFNKYNKSTKAKHPKTDKKDVSTNKKSSTAEPIIYLFALVFIYLLLKAASDINQHYKSVSLNKNERCQNLKLFPE